MSKKMYAVGIGALILSALIIISSVKLSRPAVAAAPVFLPAGAVYPGPDFIDRADAYKRYAERIGERCRKGLQGNDTIAEMTICEQVLLQEIQAAIPAGMQYDPKFRALVPIPPAASTPTAPLK